MQSKGWVGSFSEKGTLTRDRIGTVEQILPEFEVTYGKFTIVYRLVRKYMRVKQQQCPHCEEWMSETENYIAQYYIRELWIGRHEYTERYKIDGDLTQTAYVERLGELKVTEETTDGEMEYVT